MSDASLPQLPPPADAGAKTPTTPFYFPWEQIAALTRAMADLAEEMADLRRQRMQTATQTPAAPTSSSTPVLQRPSVQLGVAATGIGAILQALGLVGMPVGEAATQNGLLTTLLPVVTTAIGATGGFGTIASIALKVVGALAKASAAQK